jgi:hypothetical protein
VEVADCKKDSLVLGRKKVFAAKAMMGKANRPIGIKHNADEAAGAVSSVSKQDSYIKLYASFNMFGVIIHLLYTILLLHSIGIKILERKFCPGQDSNLHTR